MVLPSIYGLIQSNEAAMPSTLEIACVVLNNVRPENRRRRQGGKGEDRWLDEVFNFHTLLILSPDLILRIGTLIIYGIIIAWLFLFFFEFRDPIAWSAP